MPKVYFWDYFLSTYISGERLSGVAGWKQRTQHGGRNWVFFAADHVVVAPDVLGGATATRSTELNDALSFYQNAAGGVPSPIDCFLVQRGPKTLAVRMDRHQANAFGVAEVLRGSPSVEALHTPLHFPSCFSTRLRTR
jgi:hypothetical protein